MHHEDRADTGQDTDRASMRKLAKTLNCPIGRARLGELMMRTHRSKANLPEHSN